MTSPASQIAQDILRSDEARRHIMAFLMEFEAALLRRDWLAAEAARAKVVAAMESHLDQLAAAHRRLAGM